MKTIVWDSGSQTQCTLESPGGLLRYRLLASNPRVSVSKSGVEKENMHFELVLSRCCCDWSVGHTLSSTNWGYFSFRKVIWFLCQWLIPTMATYFYILLLRKQGWGVAHLFPMPSVNTHVRLRRLLNRLMNWASVMGQALN